MNCRHQPILHLLQQSDEGERHRLSEIILNGDDEDMTRLVERAVEAGAIKSAVATGRKMLREAQTHLEIVPANKYRDALANLVTALDGMIAPFGSTQPV